MPRCHQAKEKTKSEIFKVQEEKVKIFNKNQSGKSHTWVYKVNALCDDRGSNTLK